MTDAKVKYEGIINILKPPGMTSSNVVCDVRHILSEKRVGHTGTLDPGAAGVLPICVGRATRLFDYLADKEKEYIAEITFGTQTDTLDSYGKITKTGNNVVSLSDLQNATRHFIGDITQTAPMYSAVSVNGTRLYKLARQGIASEEIERKKRTVTIKYIDILDKTGEYSYLLKIGCTKGTYIRTLLSDIADYLGTVSYTSFLLRTASGHFNLDNSVSIKELENAFNSGSIDKHLVSVENVLTYPKYTVIGEKNIKQIKNGVEINNDSVYPKDTLIKIYQGKDFLGIGIVSEETIRMKTFFGQTQENE